MPSRQLEGVLKKGNSVTITFECFSECGINYVVDMKDRARTCVHGGTDSRKKLSMAHGGKKNLSNASITLLLMSSCPLQRLSWWLETGIIVNNQEVLE